MFKLAFITCVCVMGLNWSGLANGKPITGVQRLGTPAVSTVKMSRSIALPDGLVKLVQYAMRTMASRINVTSLSTRRKIYQLKDRESFESAKKVGEKSFGYMDRKLEKPYQTVTEKGEKLESLVQASSTVLPNTTEPEAHVDVQLGGNGAVLLPLEDQEIPNNSLLPLAKVAMSSIEDRDLLASNIRISNLTIERISSLEKGSSAMSLPFEAIITFARQDPSSLSKDEDRDVEIIPTRDPPDDFPPYFDTVLSQGSRTADSVSNPANFNSVKYLNPAEDYDKEKYGALKPMAKRQTPKAGEFEEMVDFVKQNKNESKNDGVESQTPLGDLIAPEKTYAEGFISVKFDENGTETESQSDPAFQRQEIEEEDEGSLGSITDLLPLVLPILEDLSNPNTDTDIAEFLEAGLPLVQGLSQPDGENDGIDFAGILSPIIASLSGPSRRGNGTVLQAILPLVVPLVTPLIGPIVGPIIQGLNNPADQGGSSITPVIQALAGPLSVPAMPGGISPAAGLISGVIASLSRDLKAGSRQGGSDVGALVSTLVSGVVAGGSAGLSGGSMKPAPPPRQNGYGTYGQAPVPASSVDPLELVTASVKEIFGLSLQLVNSVASSVSEILGASSAEQPKPVYGPANHKSPSV